MKKHEFINKWKRFWCFHRGKKELDLAFEKELNEVILEHIENKKTEILKKLIKDDCN